MTRPTMTRSQSRAFGLKRRITPRQRHGGDAGDRAPEKVGVAEPFGFGFLGLC